MLDDAALLIRFSQDRSNDAFAELVRRYLNFVYSTALRQVAGDTHLAEDVSQSVFSDLARKAKAVSDCPVLARWLYACTHHAAAKAVRTEQRRRSREKMAQSVKDLFDEPAHDAEWARIRPLLDDAMRGLSQRDSDAILMRFFEERSFAAIGERLSLTENAARMRVERALEKLRGILSRRGISSTTVVLAAMLSNEAIVAAPAGLVGVVMNGALASTASGSGAVANIFQYMSTAKLGIGAAALVVAVAMGLDGFGFRAVCAADTALISAQGQYDARFRQLQELRAQQGAAVRRRTDLEGAIAALGAKQTAARALVDAQAGLKGSASSEQRPSVPPVRVADPKLKADLQTWFKGMSAMRFDPFFNAAGFTTEQQDRMLDLLSLQKSLVLSGLVASMRPDSVSSDQITQEIQDFLATMNVEQQYQDFKRTADLRPVAAALAANLSFTDTPLSASQGEQLTQILANNSPMGEPMYPQTVNWENALTQAQTVLSGPQAAMLRNEAVLVSSGGVIGNSFRPAGSLGGQGDEAPDYLFVPPIPGKP